MGQNKLYLVKGQGIHKDRSTSLMLAHKAAGIAHLNLIDVPLTLPSPCALIKKHGVIPAATSRPTLGALLYISSDIVNQRIEVALGAAIGAQLGFVSRLYNRGEAFKDVDKLVRYRAAAKVAEYHGVSGLHKGREQMYETDEFSIPTASVHEVMFTTPIGWSTVLVAAVLID